MKKTIAIKVKKALFGIGAVMAPLLWGGIGSGLFTACSDEPDSDHFYTFTGEMMSDYLKTRPQYSDFTSIVERAGLMDLLSTYGQYTCFVPNNDAVKEYLAGRGISSIDQLTKADCDTIAKTHIVTNMYSTFDMNGKEVHTANMNRRYIPTIQGFDADSNAVIYLNTRGAYIIHELKDDSVENGIVQPISQVLETSNGYINDIVRANKRISTFYKAMEVTGVKDDIDNTEYEDPNWDPNDYPYYDYSSDGWQERGWVPETKKTGFTIFVETDSLLETKYNIPKGDMKALYDLACSIYDPVYPGDVGKEGHSYDNLKSDINPLRRFVQYHILTRYVPGSDKLTPKILKVGSYDGALGFDTKRMNPVDWYETMLPHTMIKVEQLTVQTNPDYGINFLQHAVLNERYINRRVDNIYPVEEQWNKGQRIFDTVEKEYDQDALNGHYFYVDDLVAFSEDVQQKIQNMRIRMDFSTIFPEVMTNDLRQMGDWLHDQRNRDEDPNPKYGKDYYFPMGYLKNVKFNDNTCKLVLRRPHTNFWSFEGDEWNLFGDYDIEFKLPPVPFTGEWQVRLGFCALGGRGIAQVYLDGKPQGIPIDMRLYLTDPQLLGISDVMPSEDENTNIAAYEEVRKNPELLAENQKALRNLGVYRGPYASNHVDPNSGYASPWVGNWRTYRRIVSQQRMDATQDHYIRFRVASESKTGENNLFMLDYLEIVPKSVYGVEGTGLAEDDY